MFSCLSPCAHSGWGLHEMAGPRQGGLFRQVSSLITRHPGVAWPARPPSRSSSAPVQQAWGCLRGGTGRALHVLDLPVLCSFVPSGKCRTPPPAAQPICPPHRSRPLAPGPWPSTAWSLLLHTSLSSVPLPCLLPGIKDYTLDLLHGALDDPKGLAPGSASAWC